LASLTPKIILSGLRASGLYICSVIGNTALTTNTRLSQFYVRKYGTGSSTSYLETKVGADVPATGTISWSVSIVPQSGTTPASFSLIVMATVAGNVSVGITLLANTPNFS
jgi:hypothetical protein